MNKGTNSPIDFSIPFAIDFSLLNGLSSSYKPTRRKLSQMKGMYYKNDALLKMLETDDPIVYEFYELGAPEDAGDLAFGTSIVYPGQVDGEYFMTKGHFHTIIGTSEVYICLKGQGVMLQENPEGEWSTEELVPGRAVYCAQRYAHRSINTGTEPLVTFYAFRADAGHDYGTIETKGYRKLLVEAGGKPAIVDNPRWK
jgi:glucose-6-phosphate isomerase, archaeal